MRLRENAIINDISVHYFMEGWWGEWSEGEAALTTLGLPSQMVPFDVAQFLRTGKCKVIIDQDMTLSVAFTKESKQIIFTCEWWGKPRTIRLYREWDSEDADLIQQLESYSIGECTRNILIGKKLV